MYNMYVLTYRIVFLFLTNFTSAKWWVEPSSRLKPKVCELRILAKGWPIQGFQVFLQPVMEKLR